MFTNYFFAQPSNRVKLKIGDMAPDFILFDQNGLSHSLIGYRGSWLLLYFYPKDHTEGCTKEACGIRDDFFGFKKLGVRVVGVSIDSIEVHKSFAEEYNLPFTLLSDVNKEVVKLYGVWGRDAAGRESFLQSRSSRPRIANSAGIPVRKKKFRGNEYDGTHRTSFLINPKGTIEKIYENVKPAEHSKEVLEDLRGMGLVPS